MLFERQSPPRLMAVGSGYGFVFAKSSLAFGRFGTQQVGGVHIAAFERASAALLDAFGRGFMRSNFGHDNLSIGL